MERLDLLCKAKTMGGEWVEGYYYYRPWMDEGYKHLLRFKKDSHFIDRVVKPSTICKCTGLKDKNGVLIYEGDIVIERHSEGQQLEDPFVIVWEDNFYLKHMKYNSKHVLSQKGKYNDGKFSYDYECEFEVIGQE